MYTFLTLVFLRILFDEGLIKALLLKKTLGGGASTVSYAVLVESSHSNRLVVVFELSSLIVSMRSFYWLFICIKYQFGNAMK